VNPDSGGKPETITPDDGGPVFPLPDGTELVRDWHPGHGGFDRSVKASTKGMTLRDYFAAKALQSIIHVSANASGFSNPDPAVWMAEAKCAYGIADAMISARNK
jgi:hypothetical protein